MADHEHRWLISDIRTLVRLNEDRQCIPDDLRGTLRCSTCTAALYNISMAQLKEEIAQDHVQGASLAQWASIAPLFQ